MSDSFVREHLTRAAAVRALGILDTAEEERFDRLTLIAAQTLRVPIALVSILDTDRQWFKSRHGLCATETPLSAAFCAYTVEQPDVLVVPDALLDPRFQDNPLVNGEPHIRFYAGAKVCSPDGMPVGTLCVIDREPRDFSEL